MPFKTDIATVRTIGIDTCKNTLHMIGLDEKGTIVCGKRSLAAGSPHDL
jgi:hypothetical protein